MNATKGEGASLAEYVSNLVLRDLNAHRPNLELCEAGNGYKRGIEK